MYPNNIYIKNYGTIKKYAGDIGVQLDKFWRSIQTGVPELLSMEDKRLLGL